MCGIAGIYGSSVKPDLLQLKVLADSIAHRGPDGDGFWLHPTMPLGLAHRRLSIIDLSNSGAQPMQWKERFTIVYNGEIYNYLELKKELEAEGVQFSTFSDTEVLLALYERLGVKALDKLDGMFAFAIWDDVEKELFLARDRFGEKPLFYSIIGDAFYFASEMKALFASGASDAISEDRAYKYLQDNCFIDSYDPGTTFYANVRQLDAACYMRVREGKIVENVLYWNLNDIPVNHNLSINDAAAQLRSLLKESIRIRLRSDVSIGVCLSGGIDSSSIAMLLHQMDGIKRPEHAFSARFSKFKKDEGSYIAKVLNACPELRPYFTWPDADGLRRDIERLAYAQEEPFYSGSIYNQFCVMRLAAEQGVTVLLEGQGSDEQLAGYNHYYQHHLTWLFLNNFRKYLSERKSYREILGELYPYHLPRRLPVWYIKKLFKTKKFVYDESVRNLLLDDTTRTGLKSLLRYGDRNSMAFGRELRLPFLSHKFSEFVFSLPIELILHQGWTKYVLRKSMDGLVPKDIVWRKDKVGFEPPQDDWLKALQDITTPCKNAIDYRQFTGGRKVDVIGDWKWLMIKLFFDKGLKRGF
jgi:asparagine synthase (glutamine-hydrolysing)